MPPDVALEVFGAVVGAVAVWLMVRENVWCWPVGIVNLATYVLVFGRERLYGAMGLQIAYIVLSVYGWYEWRKGDTSGATLRVSRAPRRLLLALLGAALLFSLLLASALRSFTDAVVPWIDAPLTSLSLVAQALQTRKWIENWWVWIVVNVAYVGLYASRSLWATAALYIVFLVLAIVGLRQWRSSMARPMPVPPA